MEGMKIENSCNNGAETVFLHIIDFKERLKYQFRFIKYEIFVLPSHSWISKSEKWNDCFTQTICPEIRFSLKSWPSNLFKSSKIFSITYDYPKFLIILNSWIVDLKKYFFFFRTIIGFWWNLVWCWMISDILNRCY